MDTILKKKDSKATKLLRICKSQRDTVPMISYVMGLGGTRLVYPAGHDYPLKRQVAPLSRPPPTTCCLCSNLKRYSCSKTGRPLCSLQCYKRNLSLNHQA